jgi:hypothetical protein
LDLKRVREHVDQLAAKFDTVQVFATRFDITTGNTVAVNVGAGNWHARRGQVEEWVTKQDEIIRAEALEELDD